MDKIDINIQVGDFKHPLTIPRDDEPIFREAARLISDRLATYRTKYRVANLSQEYLLSFVALDIASKYVGLQRTNSVAPVEEALKDLISELEDINQTR